MDINALGNLNDSDKAALCKLAKIIRKERAQTRAQKSRYEGIIASHQAQLSSIAKEQKQLVESSESPANKAWVELKVSEARKEVQDQNDTRITNIQNSLASVRDALKQAEKAKLASDQSLTRARESAAQDASLILQLREELQQLRDNKERLMSDSLEKHARSMQLLRQSTEADSKVMHYEESNEFLRSELKRMTTELVKTRTQMDTLSSSNDVALNNANQTNIELSQQLASANTRIKKLSTDISTVERHIIDLQGDFDREKGDLQSQIESLKKLVEMHREATKDAEIRLAGYTEVLGTLAKEKKDSQKRSSQQGAPYLDRHAEVLFKNLNQVLDAKLDVLERERHELLRARAAEARMATKLESLKREVETARRESQEARQQVVLLESELSTQKESLQQARRASELGVQASGFQSPSILPRTDNMRASLPINRPSFGYGPVMSTATPTPFRNAGGLVDAEQALAGIMDIRRRHEAILDGIRERRRDYAEFLND